MKGRYSHRLSPNFDLVNSCRGSLVMRMRKVNNEFGRHSLFFRGPILWNGFNNETRIQNEVTRFKVALKKCNLEQISLMKGTCVILNKKFRWFLLLLTCNFNLRCSVDRIILVLLIAVKLSSAAMSEAKSLPFAG